MLFNTDDILETTRMITQNKLDVRTITMGISLRDCGHPDIKVTAQKIYDKICRKAEHLVKTGEDIEVELGVPIIADFHGWRKLRQQRLCTAGTGFGQRRQAGWR